MFCCRMRDEISTKMLKSVSIYEEKLKKNHQIKFFEFKLLENYTELHMPRERS